MSSSQSVEEKKKATEEVRRLLSDVTMIMLLKKLVDAFEEHLSLTAKLSEINSEIKKALTTKSDECGFYMHCKNFKEQPTRILIKKMEGTPKEVRVSTICVTAHCDKELLDDKYFVKVTIHMYTDKGDSYVVSLPFNDYSETYLLLKNWDLIKGVLSEFVEKMEEDGRKMHGKLSKFVSLLKMSFG